MGQGSFDSKSKFRKGELGSPFIRHHLVSLQVICRLAPLSAPARPFPVLLVCCSVTLHRLVRQYTICPFFLAPAPSPSLRYFSTKMPASLFARR